MSKKPVTIGGIYFAKKGDALTHMKAMLDRYDIGDRVNASDTEFLRAALSLHPEATAKIGSGVVYFSVRSADFGSKCFWVNRTDGSTEKFSYKSCASSSSTSLR